MPPTWAINPRLYFRYPHCLVPIALIPSCVASAAEPSGFKPGLWEVTQTFSGAPRSAEPLTYRQCVTSEQLGADPATPLKIRPAAPTQRRVPGCDLGPAEMANGMATVAVSCKTPLGTAQTRWIGPYASGSFSLEGVLKFGVFAVRMRTTGIHLGACQS